MQLKEQFNRGNKNIPFLDGLQVKNQYMLLSEVGNMPARNPPPVISRYSGSTPWLVGYSANPLADKRPEKSGSFRPRYFATTEYIPSHPTKTCNCTWACLISQVQVLVSFYRLCKYSLGTCIFLMQVHLWSLRICDFNPIISFFTMFSWSSYTISILLHASGPSF